MKKLLIIISTVVMLSSCSKEDPDPQRDTFMTFQGKYLVCDSIRTTVNGRSTTRVVGKGKGWDLNFGPYGNLDVYTSPVTTKSYQFEGPDKIYYWTTAFQSDKFYTIQLMAGKKMVLVDTESDTGNVLTEFFTAE